MNWNRSSSALVVAALLLVAVVPAAAAVPTVSGDAPQKAQVNDSVDQTYTLNNLFEEYNEWTLSGETDLTAVTWTVTTYDNTGQQIDKETYTGTSFSHHLLASDGAVKTTVRLQATVPEVPDSKWSYDPAQQYTVAAFSQAQEGGSSTELASYATQPFTDKSQQAQSAIGTAQQAIADAEDAGADVSEAQTSLDNAISAYENANFDLASNLASEAEEKANNAKQSKESSQQTTQLLIYGVVGLVVLLVVAGGALYFLRNRDSHDKLA